LRFRQHLSGLAFVFMLLLLNSCIEPPNEPLPAIGNSSIIAVLSTGTSLQKIYFYSVTHLEDTRYPDELFVHNAVVEVNGLQFQEMSDSLEFPKNFYGLQFPQFVQPDSTYSLVVRNGQEIIRGRTTTPGHFSVISHPKELYIHLDGATDTVELHWQESHNARGYIVNQFSPPFEYPSGSGRFIPGGLLSWISKSNHATITVDKVGRYVIKIAAFDENYEKHFVLGYQVAGVEGAYGVFASMAVDSIVINVMRTQLAQ